jgi:hypothetical protein
MSLNCCGRDSSSLASCGPGKQVSRTGRPRPPPQGPDDDDDADEGPKLGLGDFIFYSVLVGKAAEEAPIGIAIGCSYAILSGMVARNNR